MLARMIKTNNNLIIIIASLFDYPHSVWADGRPPKRGEAITGLWVGG